MISRLPERTQQRIRRWRRPATLYLLGRRTTPISDSYGMDRGQPVDRYFIEQFLDENRHRIRGACLEVRTADYICHFGQGVTRQDVLDIEPTNKSANIIGDLRDLSMIADAMYDCVILTQVLLYIDDLERAVREVARILKPGGSVLVSVPAIHRGEHSPHCWKFTSTSAEYLFSKVFPRDACDIRSWGNVLTGTAIWVGLAVEDLPRSKLDRHDPNFPSIITIRATKPG